jgi:hypothetical protein
MLRRHKSILLSLLLPAALGSACHDDALPSGEPGHPHADDGGAPDDAARPLRARVWANDPISDEALIEVTLASPTSDDGTLTGQFVNALNCLNEEGGQSLFGFATLCVESKTVVPDEAGSYLHVEPPDDEADMNDPFAELMMYHHVTAAHDYFRGTHEFTGLDFPLDAVVNVSIYVQGAWQSFSNAAFIPEDSFAAFGLPARPVGAIMFGQGDPVDFSYDASVIIHEYSHALIGTGRLQGAFLDEQGLNNTPGAINEAVADYFAATVLGNPRIGPYALGTFARDLLEPRTCPDDLTTAIHTDGKILGSALWRVREAVGAGLADAAVFGAVQAASLATGFEEMGALVLGEVARLSPEHAASVAGILAEHGLLECQRVKAWKTVNLVATTGLPLAVAGRQSVSGSFPAGVPAHLQLLVAQPEAAFVELEWRITDSNNPFGGGAPSPLSLALRVGEPITLDGAGGVRADVVLDPPFATDTTQRVVVDGACASELYTMFLNKGGAPANVGRLAVRSLAAAPAGVDVVGCP